MNTGEDFMIAKLTERRENGLLRKLTDVTLPYDFCSNDYLGFARSAELRKAIQLESQNIDHYQNGAGGSRLLSGNHPYTEQTEKFVAVFHHAASGLIFNSGYDANIGLLSALAQRGDTLITDELIHASLIDGARLSNATRYKFKHNDTDDLEQKLKIAKGIIYVAIESVYSMDGDCAPLNEISKLCKQYNANLIVDEAHSIGVFGEKGKGLVVQLGLEHEVFARIVTFGKALGVHGAIVLGSHHLREFLINFARSFIYTTAAPIHHIVAINCAYRLLSSANYEAQIKTKIELYLSLAEQLQVKKTASQSAIQTILCNGNEEARALAIHLQNAGFDVRPILSPTVAAGKERLRICLHTFNTDQEIESLVETLKKIKING
jgi:8-amino-7-oxononanoate synthase